MVDKHCAECNEIPNKPKECSRCKQVIYCGLLCQTVHWPEHKQICARPSGKTEPPGKVRTAAELSALNNIKKELMKAIDEDELYNKIITTVHKSYGHPHVSAALAHASVMRNMADLRSVVVIILNQDDGNFTIPEERFCHQIIDVEFQKMLKDDTLLIGDGILGLENSGTSLGAGIREVYNVKKPKMVPIIILTKSSTTGEFVRNLGNNNFGFIHNFPIPNSQ